MISHAMLVIAIGVFVGVFGGLMGLGGGAVMIPILVLALGFRQEQAHGTSLAAMLAPVAILAVIKYYRAGDVDVKTAILLAVGITVGAYFGASLALWLADNYRSALRLTFGFVLIYVAAYTVFSNEQVGRSVALAGVVTLLAMATYALSEWGAARP